jgi:hypothetical protein
MYTLNTKSKQLLKQSSPTKGCYKQFKQPVIYLMPYALNCIYKLYNLLKAKASHTKKQATITNSVKTNKVHTTWYSQNVGHLHLN